MFDQIIAGILSITTVVTGWFGLVPQLKITQLETKVQQLELQLEDFQNISLGSYYPTGGKYYNLYGNGITSSATSLILSSFKTPVNDYELSMANFGEIYYGVIEPENTSNMEIISFTGITQDSGSDKATLTGLSRGISFTYPYSASTTLQKSHSGGSRFILSNPSAFYQYFAVKKNAETITGIWTFGSTTIPIQDYYTAPTDDKQFAPKKYVDDSTNAGAANISTTTAGIAQIATTDQLLHFTTTTGSSGRLLIPYIYYFATSTDKRGSTTTIPMTDTDGKLSQTFLDLTESYAWSGTQSVSATSTFTSDIDADGFDVDSFDNIVTIGATGATSYTLNINASTTQATTTFEKAPYSQTAASDANQLIRKAEVDAKNMDFGTMWSRNTNQYYTATSSAGFVIFTSRVNAGGLMYATTSDGVASTTVGIERMSTEHNDGTLFFSVAKNNTWIVTSTGATVSTIERVYWIPISIQ